MSGLVVLALVTSVPLASTALAEGPVVVANIDGDSLAPGNEATLTITVTPEVDTTLDHFTLTPPTDWQLVSVDGPSEGPSYAINENTLVGSNLDATSDYPASVQFAVDTGCKSGDWSWTLQAFDSESTPFGNDESSDLSTTVESNCTALATITGDPVAPGQEATLGFTVAPSGGTLDSFSLTPPANWQLVSVAASPSPSPGASNFAIEDNTLVGSDLGVTSDSLASVHFRVKTGCKSGDWDWSFAAIDENGDAYDNAPSSDLTTNVSANCTLVITAQPKDTGKNTLITGTAFDSSGSPVTVELRNGLSQTVDYFPVSVSFDLAPGTGLITTGLSAGMKTTANGVATFSGPPASTLSISNANQPFTTDFRLKPKTVGTYAGLTGANSGPFDIWDAGCKGNGCGVNLAPGTSSDAYATTENVGLGASLLGTGGTNISCPTQQVIFSSNVFFHATTGTGPVFLVSHISAADRKAAPNNGNKVMGWCVGLKNKGPWNFVRQNTNGDSVTDPNNGTWAPTVPGSDLWVGMAPKCPSKNPSSKAPCIVSQNGDGVGGTYIRGWLPGGDPPRRT
jgi:hypothetical protein